MSNQQIIHIMVDPPKEKETFEPVVVLKRRVNKGLKRAVIGGLALAGFLTLAFFCIDQLCTLDKPSAVLKGWLITGLIVGFVSGLFSVLFIVCCLWDILRDKDQLDTWEERAKYKEYDKWKRNRDGELVKINDY